MENPAQVHFVKAETSQWPPNPIKCFEGWQPQSVSGWFLPTFSFGDKLQVEDIHRCRSQTMLVKNYKARQEIKLNISRTFPILFSLLISCKNLNNSISPPNGKKSYIQKLFCNHYGKKIIFFICCMIFCSSYFTVLWKEMDWIKYSCACACMCNCTLLKTTIRGQVIDQKSSFVKKKKREKKYNTVGDLF